MQKTNDEKDILKRVNQLRGLLAIVVMLSHIWGYTGIVYLIPFNKVVTIAVGFFFFLSGYGMTISSGLKDDYLRGIIKVKIPYLISISILAYLLSGIFELILKRWCDINIFMPISLKKYFITTNWYVYELLGFYLLFIIVKKFVSERYQLLIVATASVIGFIILFNSGLVEAYYNSIIGFWFGMLCGKYGCIVLMDRYKKGYIIGIIILVGAFVGMFIFDKRSMLFASVRNAAAVGAIIVVIYIIRMINTDYSLLRSISSISPELYFYHMPIALLLSYILNDSYVYMTVVIIISFLVAIVIHPVNNKIQIIIKRGIN